MNIERYRMVMHRIWADLRSWNQGWYHIDMDGKYLSPSPENPVEHSCGTSHCVAGWAQVLSGETGPCSDTARKWLGLTRDESLWLFASTRILDDLNAVLKRGRVFE